MDALMTDVQPVETAYRTFRELASRIEKITRQYDLGFHWLRKDTLKASESVCAILRDVAQTKPGRESLMLLYQCRHEVREALRHVQYAVDAHLLNAPDDRIIAPYQEASQALENLIATREEGLPALWEVPLAAQAAGAASFLDSQAPGVG